MRCSPAVWYFGSSACLWAQQGASVMELMLRARSTALPVAEGLQAYEQLGWDHCVAKAPDSAELVNEAMPPWLIAQVHSEAVTALRLKAAPLSEMGDVEGAIAEVQAALERCGHYGRDEPLPKAYTSLDIHNDQLGDLGQVNISEATRTLVKGYDRCRRH